MQQRQNNIYNKNGGTTQWTHKFDTNRDETMKSQRCIINAKDHFPGIV
jgi:hypothetical protein